MGHGSMGDDAFVGDLTTRWRVSPRVPSRLHYLSMVIGRPRSGGRVRWSDVVVIYPAFFTTVHPRMAVGSVTPRRRRRRDLYPGPRRTLPTLVRRVIRIGRRLHVIDVDVKSTVVSQMIRSTTPPVRTYGMKWTPWPQGIILPVALYRKGDGA